MAMKTMLAKSCRSVAFEVERMTALLRTVAPDAGRTTGELAELAAPLVTKLRAMAAQLENGGLR